MFTKENKNDSKRIFDEILRKIRNDAEEGMRELYEIYGRTILNTAASVCSSYDAVNEVLNKVLVKIWQLAYKKPNIKNPGGFIYVVTINCAKDFLKAKKGLTLNEAMSSGENNIQKVIEEDAFLSLISCLTEYEKSIMIRRFFALETFKEISEDDKKPLSTITSVYYRCLEKVENEINKIKNNL